MKISELSSRSGVPVASVKYYLREGLLGAGEKISETQSSYDDSHLARLRLIRAFLDVGGLSVSSARAVLAAIDDDSMPFGVAAGVAASALPTPPAAAPSDAEGRGHRDLAEVIAERGWTVDPSNPGIALAARIIDDYAALGREDLLVGLPIYAQAAEMVATADMQTVADSLSRAASTETVVIGTVLGDGLFAGLRRMAHENASRAFFPVAPEVAARYGHGDSTSAPTPSAPTTSAPIASKEQS